MKRRDMLKAAGAAAAVSALGLPSVVRAQAPLRVGYVNTLAVNAQMWLAESLGYFKREKLPNVQYTMFNTGPELFQALVGGSLDVLSTGAVLSNFPARGQGKAFLINSVEYATAQLWVHPDMGINSIADLKGKTIATTIGTTAHVFLHRALGANNLNSLKDVQVVNQRMPDAVTAFISRAVPAVALWVPFNLQVRSRAPNAKMLVDASKYYPQAAIVGGWAARNDFFEKQRPTLQSLARAWSSANEYLISKPDEAVALIQKERFQGVPLADLQEQYKASKLFPTKEWIKMYKDGTVGKWLDQVTDFNVEIGAMRDPLKAATYFDATLLPQAMGA
ncbi:MAG: transporter substrate-binding protein [Paucimonas sp.]|nr:transporter substrate-binding protein [Paucimonas sp.]